jgi:hypothetical protein
MRWARKINFGGGRKQTQNFRMKMRWEEITRGGGAMCEWEKNVKLVRK